jgi:hypothetical protein
MQLTHCVALISLTFSVNYKIHTDTITILLRNYCLFYLFYGYLISTNIFEALAVISQCYDVFLIFTELHFNLLHVVLGFELSPGIIVCLLHQQYMLIYYTYYINPLWYSHFCFKYLFKIRFTNYLACFCWSSEHLVLLKRMVFLGKKSVLCQNHNLSYLWITSRALIDL